MLSLQAEKASKNMKRREFLKSSALLAVATGTSGLAQAMTVGQQVNKSTGQQMEDDDE